MMRWRWRGRGKNDERDAIDLADMLRLGRLPGGWIAPPAIRELRELVRYRAKLVGLRSGLKAQVHAVMAKEGVLPAQGRMFGPAGKAQLDAMAMAPSYTTRVASLRDLIELYDREVGRLEGQIHRQLRGHRGYQAIQGIDGLARPSLRSWWPRSATWPGSVPPKRCARGRGSLPSTGSQTPPCDGGRITKQGSKLVRWVVIEAVCRYHGGPRLA